jgi:hypothetical protein
VYNSVYAFGHRLMMVMLAVILLVFAPFVGMASACWSFMASIARQAALHVGRGLSDELGYGSFVRTRAAYVAWKRSLLRPHLPTPLPAAGVRPSSREDALHELELGVFGEWAGPVRLFNTLFSAGFLIGTVLCALLTFLCAPFVGMFVAALSFAYSLLRSFQRAEGRLITDIMGVSELVDQQVALMKEEMQLAVHPSAAFMNAAAAASAARPPSMGATGGAGAMVVANPVATATYGSYLPPGAATAIVAAAPTPSAAAPGAFYPAVPVAPAGSYQQ